MSLGEVHRVRVPPPLRTNASFSAQTMADQNNEPHITYEFMITIRFVKKENVIFFDDVFPFVFTGRSAIARILGRRSHESHSAFGTTTSLSEAVCRNIGVRFEI